MCGIIGYKGFRNACEIAVQGLKKLEYRGYDSWGIALKIDNELKLIKKVGKIGEQDSASMIKDSKVAIGHTRWALENFNRDECSHDLKHSARFNMYSKINILNLIKNENYYALVDKSFQKLINDKIKNNKSIANQIKISRRTLYRIRKKEGYWCNLNILHELGKTLKIKKSKLREHIKKIKTKNSFPIIFKDLKLDESLARVLGNLIGDGGIHVIKKEGKYKAFYVNNEDKLLNSFKSNIQNVFDEKNIYFRRREYHGDEIWLSSTIGFILYRLLEYDKLNEKRVPNWIKESNDEFICSFLQAIYDDEGFLYPNKYMIMISFSNINLLKDVKDLLNKIGMKPNKILIHKSKNRTLMYYFSITGKENIIKFYDKINFIHPTKKNKLEILRNKYGE